MRVRFLFASTIIVAIAALGGGCASTPADKQSQADPQPAMRALGQPLPSPTQSGEEIGDAAIGSEIRRLLDADPAGAAGIVVEVDGGNVTLRGAAPNLAASWRAEAAAHSVKGVKTVVNQIIAKTPAVVR